jgi:hypothetical protein
LWGSYLSALDFSVGGSAALGRLLQNQPIHDASAIAHGASDLNVFANGLARFANP